MHSCRRELIFLLPRVDLSIIPKYPQKTSHNEALAVVLFTIARSDMQFDGSLFAPHIS